jgi:hypothetical protein
MHEHVFVLREEIRLNYPGGWDEENRSPTRPGRGERGRPRGRDEENGVAHAAGTRRTGSPTRPGRGERGRPRGRDEENGVADAAGKLNALRVDTVAEIPRHATRTG